MFVKTTQLHNILCIATIAFFIFISGCAKKEINEQDYNSDFVNAWNEKIMNIAKEEDGLLTLKGLRTASMSFLAMHNAINTIKPVYQVYYFEEDGYENADPVAAAAQAAYEIALNQYPDQSLIWEEELNSSLASIVPGESKELGILLGKEAAKNILTIRENDGWNGEAEYQWHPMAPGVYAEFNEHSGTPEGFVFGAGWAKAKPFFLRSQDQFRSPPPPEINSEAYTAAYNEVKSVGVFESETRTEDQSHLAVWWKDFVENSHNRLARTIVPEKGLNLWEAARMYALMNASIFDAYVNVFDNKFYYNHWRPYTAIRWADHDENDDTVADLTWENLHKHTYPFPSYPSAHGTASAAAMTVIADTFGDKYNFTMETKEVDQGMKRVQVQPTTRSFTSFSEAALECSMSRVYLGIHFRYDSEEGTKLGKQIGNYAVDNYLQKLSEE